MFAPDLNAAPLAAAFVSAASQAGYGLSDDANGERQEGFGKVDRTTRSGRRCSTSRAYLAPALGRANLKVMTGTLVHRVLLQGDRAVGIEYAQGNALARAHSSVRFRAAGS